MASEDVAVFDRRGEAYYLAYLPLLTLALDLLWFYILFLHPVPLFSFPIKL
jgi:hypothetical protein